MFNFWVPEPYGRVDSGLAEYAAAIRKQLVGIEDDSKPPIIGDPVLEGGTSTEYNIHDGVRCCGELFGVRELAGDPWHVRVDGHTAIVMVKFNWEERI